MIIKSIEEFRRIARENCLKKSEKHDMIVDDYKWLTKAVAKLNDENIPYTIFTVLCEDDEFYIRKGLWRINRVGYIVIKNIEAEIEDEILFLGCSKNKTMNY